MAALGRDTGSGITKVGQGLQNVGGAITGVGRSMTRSVTLPIVALGVKAVSTAKGIDEAWNEVRRTMNATPAEIEQMIRPTGKLGKAVSDVSLKYGLQREEVIGVAGRLAAMGLTADEVTARMTQGIEFAVAGGIELEDGLNAVLGVSNTFQMRGKALQNTLYGLNKVENETKATAFDLSVGLSRAGGAAASLVNPTFTANEAVGTIAAGMAVLKARNQETYRSADALRAIFQRLVVPLKGTNEFWKKMGVNVADAKGQLKPMNELLPEMAKNIHKLSQQEQITFFKKQIGIEFGPLLGQILQDIGQDFDKDKDSASDFNKALKQFNDTAGGAASFSRELVVQQDSLDAATGRVGATWDLLIDTMTPIIRELLPPMLDFVQRLLGAITNLTPAQQKWLVIGLALVAALGPVLVIVGGLVTMVGLLMGPVGVVALALAAVAVAAYTVYKNWDKWGGTIKAILKPLVDVWKVIASQIMPLFKQWLPVLKVVGAVILGVLVVAIYAFSFALLGVIKVLQVVGAIFTNIIHWIANAFTWLFDLLLGNSIIPDIVNGIIGWFNRLTAPIKAVIDAIWNVVTTGFGKLKEWWDLFWGGFGGGMSGIWEGIANAVKWGLDHVKSLLGDYIRGANVILKALHAPEIPNPWDSKKVKAKGTVVSTGGWGKHRTGGLIGGSGLGDRIPALLEPGEFVVRRSAVERLGVGAMMRINAAGMQSGGMVKDRALEIAMSQRLFGEALSGAAAPVATRMAAGSLSGARSDGAGMTPAWTGDLIVHNPKPEAPSETLHRSMQRLAFHGLLRRD